MTFLFSNRMWSPEVLPSDRSLPAGPSIFAPTQGIDVLSIVTGTKHVNVRTSSKFMADSYFKISDHSTRNHVGKSHCHTLMIFCCFFTD